MTRIGLRRKQGSEENDKRYAWHQTMPNEGVGDLINDKSSTLQANDKRLRWAEFEPFCVFVQEIGRHLQSIERKRRKRRKRNRHDICPKIRCSEDASEYIWSPTSTQNEYACLTKPSSGHHSHLPQMHCGLASSDAFRWWIARIGAVSSTHPGMNARAAGLAPLCCNW